MAFSFHVVQTPLRELLTPSFYRAPWFKGPAERAIEHVPSGAPVTANDALLTHLSHRQFASEIAPGRGLAPGGYLIADLREPVGYPMWNSSFAAFDVVLRSELTATTPVYYSDGWLVAKLPPLGQRPSNGVLTPLNLGVGRQLLKLTVSWHAHFAASWGAAGRCYRLLLLASPISRACFRRAPDGLRSKQRALADALRDAAISSVGPCAALAAQSGSAIRRVGDYLLRVDALGERAARSALIDAGAALLSAIYERDLPGRLDRFLALCYPR